ncbi:MAG: cohesin domain-containing protein [Verrucomicrobia bacterium]|nr:cohesin domain-containing protein [Verrucomicrobiota bacterium]
MQRNVLLIAASTLLMLLLYGCELEREQDELTQPHQTRLTPQIHLLLAPALAQQNLEKAEVRVMDSSEETVLPQMKSFEQLARSPSFDFEVSPGEVKIEVKVHFFGLAEPAIDNKTVMVNQSVGEKRLTLTFKIDPPGELALGIDSDEFFPVSPGQEFSTYIYIRNVTALYGANVRLSFYDNFISLQKIEHSAFFWEEPDVITFSGVLGEGNRKELDLAWTRLKDSKTQGKDVKERLVTIYFKANAKGSTSIEVVLTDGDTSVFKLTDKDGNEVKDFGKLKKSLTDNPIKYTIDIGR